jgi:hypothetical protein
MEFGLFYEIPVPQPWNPRGEFEAYRNTIELLGRHVIPALK